METFLRFFFRDYVKFEAKLNLQKIYIMPENDTQEITGLLFRWSNGDAHALEELTPIIYAELYRTARRYMGRERNNHTLQTTALVNEAYLRLIDWKTAKWESRTHFFGVSAQLMRRILVDFARRRPKTKDKQEVNKVELDETCLVEPGRDTDLVALDDALNELAKFDAQKSKVVELKFFGGLKVDEIAEVLRIAPITVKREWQRAKAWLYLELNKEV